MDIKQNKFRMIREAFFATLFILAFVFILDHNPFNVPFLRSLQQEVADFDLYDLAYHADSTDFSPDGNIVIIQCEDSRKGIAAQLSALTEGRPKVIGLDVYFRALQKATKLIPDTTGTLPLKDVILTNTNSQIPIVSSYYFDGSENGKPGDLSNNLLDSAYLLKQAGYINFAAENDNMVIRQFRPFNKHGQDIVPALATRIIQHAYPSAYEKLKRRNNELETINYAGASNHFITYTAAQFWEKYSNHQLKGLIEDKIVLLGYFDPSEKSLEDLKFTPMSGVKVGNHLPDMYGIFVQANIIAMLVSGNYIKTYGTFASYALSFVFTFTLMLIVIVFHGKEPGFWESTALLTAQVFFIIMLCFLVAKLFDWFQLKFLLVPPTLALLLAIDKFGAYKVFIGYLNRKFKLYTLFPSQKKL